MLHHLPVLEAVPVLVPLEDVVPLSSLLVPVAVAKQRIAQVGGILNLDVCTVAVPTSTVL
jgi:hypothetical protein